MKLIGFAVLLLPSLVCGQAPRVAPADAPSQTVVAPSNEPGERLLITGIVYAADGRTPLANASVYVYQTDARGYYKPDDARASDDPRLRGYMRTDKNGRYEFRTIRPGSYPGSRNPGHIHYHVNAPSHRERVFEIVFEGDPFIPEQWKQEAQRAGSGVAIVKLTRDGARGWRGVQDVVVQ